MICHPPHQTKSGTSKTAAELPAPIATKSWLPPIHLENVNGEVQMVLSRWKIIFDEPFYLPNLFSLTNPRVHGEMLSDRDQGSAVNSIDHPQLVLRVL